MTPLNLTTLDQISLGATDLDAAQQFYTGVLGLPCTGDIPGMAKLFTCTGGVNLIIFKSDPVPPSSIIYFKVDGVADRLAETLEKLRSAGAKVEKDPQCIAKNWNGHDVWLAFFRDPFNNMLALKSDVPTGG
jgi:methylmalonyl-CoA/ethylmalonyl-CoA epimerase